MHEFALPVRMAILPFSLVNGVIWPHLLPLAISKVATPLPSVPGLRFVDVSLFINSWRLRIIFIFTDSFQPIISNKIPHFCSAVLHELADSLSG